MNWTFAISVANLCLLAVGLGFWKPWLGAYGGEKGKNLARKEDLDAILTEVKAVTAATKEIESKLAGDLWNRQTIWNQRRDLYGTAIRLVHSLGGTYTRLQFVAAELAVATPNTNIAALKAQVRVHLKTLNDSLDELRQTNSLLEIFGENNCPGQIWEYILSDKADDSEAFKQRCMASFSLIASLVKAAKNDLGIVEREGRWYK